MTSRKLVITRGRVYLAPTNGEQDADTKFWLCVSNNERNPRLEEFIAVRMTSTRKPQLASWVLLGQDDRPWVSVACDDLGPIYRDQVIKDAGALSAPAMRRVDRALLVVLGIDVVPAR